MFTCCVESEYPTVVHLRFAVCGIIEPTRTRPTTVRRSGWGIVFLNNSQLWYSFKKKGMDRDEICYSFAYCNCPSPIFFLKSEFISRDVYKEAQGWTRRLRIMIGHVWWGR